MKIRIKFLFITFLLLLGVESILAQSHLRHRFYGDIFAGMTLATMDMENENAYKKNRIGMAIGVNLNYKVLGNMELQTGFHIIKKGLSKHQKTNIQHVAGHMEYTNVRNEIDANYIQVPLNIGFEIPLIKEVFYIHAHGGVYAAYGFKGKKYQKGYRITAASVRLNQDIDKTSAFDSTTGLKKWDYGLNANVGLVYDIFIFRLQYDYGLANVASSGLIINNKDQTEWKTRNISIALGFRF